MFRTTGISGNKGQINIGFQGAGQLAFSFFSRFFQTLQSHFIIPQINPLGFAKLFSYIVQYPLIKILAAEESIAIGGFDFKNSITQFHNRDIECSTTQVKYRDFPLSLFILTIRQGCGRWFINNSQHIQAGNLTGIFSSLTLAVIKIGRYRNYSISHRFAQVIFRRLFHFLQNHGRYFRRAVLLSLDFHPGIPVFCLDNFIRDLSLHLLNLGGVKFTSDQTLHRKNGLIRIGNCLSLGQLAHQPLTRLGKCNHRRCGSSTLSISNNF